MDYLYDDMDVEDARIELDAIVGDRRRNTYETYYSQREINDMKNIFGNIGSDIIQNGAKLGMVRSADGRKIRDVTTFAEHDLLINDREYYDHLEDILDEDAKERYRQDLMLRPATSVEYVKIRPSIGEFLSLNKKYIDHQSQDKNLLFPSNKKDNINAVEFLKVSNANYVNDVLEFETPF